ncbi:MAG: c-type cytochrome [Povalibacter sp.]
MRRFLKWLGIALGAIASVALLATLYVYVASQLVISRSYEVPLIAFNAPSDRESAQKGARLTSVYGCNNCHGTDLTGSDMFDIPGIVHITAPNLTKVVKEYTDAELERVIRRGVKRDGTSTWIMPSAMFSRLSDEDLSAIVAYVRSFPERPGIDRLTELRVLGRIGVLQGKFLPQATQIQNLPALHDTAGPDPLAQGRYLVMTSCTECHGATLQGSDFIKAPNLAVAGAYSDGDFLRLMREGIGMGDRHLGLMGEVARARFAHFSDAEVQAIRSYLQTFAQSGTTQLP